MAGVEEAKKKWRRQNLDRSLEHGSFSFAEFLVLGVLVGLVGLLHSPDTKTEAKAKKKPVRLCLPP